MEIAHIGTVLIAFIGCFIFTGKTIYHTWFIVTNIKGKYANYLGPLVFLMPSQLNDAGNKHRRSLGPALLGIIICWLVLFLSRALTE